MLNIFNKNKCAQDKNREDISIVMPVYNHEDTLEEALESALMQEMQYKKVIYCFDDVSTDKSSEILAKYKNKYPDTIRVFKNPKNLGSGKASYLYHRPSIKGRYWCLLAGDDYWTSHDKLAKQVAYLDDNLNYVGCSCDSVLINEVNGDESIIKPSCNHWNLLDLLLLKHKYSFYVHTTSLLWRNIYLPQGFFLPESFQKQGVQGDVVLMHAMLSKGGKVYNIPEIMSCYRVTGRGIWTSKSAQEQSNMNENLPKLIEQVVPKRYKVFTSLQELRDRSDIIKKIVPGPVN